MIGPGSAGLAQGCRCALPLQAWAGHIMAAADPLPGGAGRPTFNQLETVTSFTYKPSLVKIDARNFDLLW